MQVSFSVVSIRKCSQIVKVNVPPLAGAISAYLRLAELSNSEKLAEVVKCVSPSPVIVL